MANSAGGVVLGCILFVGAFPVHAWNERNSVREIRAIAEVAEVALAGVSSTAVNPSNEGFVVHTSGTGTTSELVSNEAFAVEENAIRLQWDSSIYQLVEDRVRRDGRTTYEYEEKWVNDVVDSSNFRDRPAVNAGTAKSLPEDGQDQASIVEMDAFFLSPKLVDQIDSDVKYGLRELSPALSERGSISDGVFWTGDPARPEIGDEKIEFSIVRAPVDVTVVAKQQGDSFTSYRTESGKEKEILYVGTLSKEEVISRQQSEARILRWALRGGGFVAMWFGILMLIRPFQWLADRVPFFGQLFSAITGLAAALVAAALSFLTIAIFWFAFRPLVSLALLVAVGVSGAIALSLQRRSESESVPASFSASP